MKRISRSLIYCIAALLPLAALPTRSFAQNPPVAPRLEAPKKPLMAGQEQVVFEIKDFPSGGRWVVVADHSALPITALALRCPRMASKSDPDDPMLLSVDGDSAWGYTIGADMEPWESIVGDGEHLDEIRPGKTVAIRPVSHIGECLVPGSGLGGLFGAAVFADGSSLGDERIVAAILRRRRLVYKDVQIAIRRLEEALQRREAPAALVSQFNNLVLDTHAPGSKREEQLAATVVFGMVASDLQRREKMYGQGTTGARAIGPVLGIIKDWRARLLASKPPFRQ